MLKYESVRSMSQAARESVSVAQRFLAGYEPRCPGEVPGGGTKKVSVIALCRMVVAPQAAANVSERKGMIKYE